MQQGKPKRVNLTLKKDTKYCIATLQTTWWFLTFSLPSFPPSLSAPSSFLKVVKDDQRQLDGALWMTKAP